VINGVLVRLVQNDVGPSADAVTSVADGTATLYPPGSSPGRRVPSLPRASSSVGSEGVRIHPHRYSRADWDAVSENIDLGEINQSLSTIDHEGGTDDLAQDVESAQQLGENRESGMQVEAAQFEIATRLEEVVTEQLMEAYKHATDRALQLGKLPATAAAVLKDAAEVMVDPSMDGDDDNDDVTLDTWFEKVIRPEVLKLAAVNYQGQLPCIGGWTKVWDQNAHTNAIEVCQGFIHVSEHVIAMCEEMWLSEAQPGIVKALSQALGHLRNCISAAETELQAQTERPNGESNRVLVETRRASVRLVNKGLKRAETLYDEGMLMEAEYDKVKEVMQHAKGRIRRKYMRNFSDDFTLPPDFLDQVLSHADKKTGALAQSDMMKNSRSMATLKHDDTEIDM